MLKKKISDNTMRCIPVKSHSTLWFRRRLLRVGSMISDFYPFGSRYDLKNLLKNSPVWRTWGRHTVKIIEFPRLWTLYWHIRNYIPCYECILYFCADVATPRMSSIKIFIAITHRRKNSQWKWTYIFILVSAQFELNNIFYIRTDIYVLSVYLQVLTKASPTASLFVD